MSRITCQTAIAQIYQTKLWLSLHPRKQKQSLMGQCTHNNGAPKEERKKKKKRMHGAKHLCHLTLLLPSAKSRNHVHATQHHTLDNTTTTLIYLFKFKSKQLRRQKGWHYCICTRMKVCVCVHVCERVVPQRLVVCQLYISLKQFHFLSLRYGFMCFSFHFCKWHQKNVRPSDCLATPSTYLAVM